MKTATITIRPVNNEFTWYITYRGVVISFPNPLMCYADGKTAEDHAKKLASKLGYDKCKINYSKV